MAKKQFTDEERYAVFTAHGERCYLCREPIDLMTMEVDHVIPESLLDDPARLAAVLKGYGLGADFDLQSFANWLPACGPCNNRKRGRVFDPTPLIQVELQIARDKAPRASELAAKRVSKKKASKAWNQIKRSYQDGTLDEFVQKEIWEFTAFHRPLREAAVRETPVRLTPLITILSEKDGIRVVRGPYGVGGGPIGPHVHGSFQCPTCGHTAWNGARCVVCGQMDDD